ncbi:CD209 antigen-like protein [Labeo rohita]|uniref:CD209 antigen-like protein n=1 Tax=Labeo rohita TaxID=84645 RepID=A0A498MV50_LABRO|nr:CD209 antigen-like protein [Labeo rohita]
MELVSVNKNDNHETCSKYNEMGLDKDEDIYANQGRKLSQTEARAQNIFFFMSTEVKSWSDSSQYCRDHGADLVIINSEEKQRFISSFTKERVWIGLSDREQEGKMKWVDNSALKQGEVITELVGVYKNDNHKTCSKYNEMGTDRDEDIYANQGQKLSQTEARTQNRGLSVGNKCVVLSTVCISFICIFLVAAIVVLHIKFTAEREVQATHMLQSISRDQAEKAQLQNSFNSLSQKKLELETRVNDLTAEKRQLQNSLNSLSQKKLELETELTKLSEQVTGYFFLSNEEKSWSDSRQYCRNHGGDLVIINSEEKQRIMDIESIYANVECRAVKNTTGPQTQGHSQDEGKDLKHKGSRCLVLITVSLGLICVLLLVFIILQHFTITAERDLIKSYKNTVEEFNQTINSLQDNYTDLMIEKHQLQTNFSSLNQKNLELESRVTSLSEELKKEASKQRWFFMSNELKSWSDSRKYCKDHGADLVIINSEEKQKFIASFTTERVWIGLSDTEQQGNMKWVDNSQLKQGNLCGPVCLFLSNNAMSWSDSRQYCRDHGADLVIINSEEKQHFTITAERDLIKSYKNTVEEFNQTINSLQHNYTDLMIEKHQLQNNFSSLNQKNLELESRVTSLSEELKKEASKQHWFFLSNETKSWSDSRQYCRDRGADLVIINSEEKQVLD